MSSTLTERIRADYQRRMNINSRYSLRAYAKHLGINVSIVSRILSGQTPVSLKMLERIASPLNLSNEEKDIFAEEIKIRKES